MVWLCGSILQPDDIHTFSVHFVSNNERHVNTFIHIHKHTTHIHERLHTSKGSHHPICKRLLRKECVQVLLSRHIHDKDERAGRASCHDLNTNHVDI